MCCSLDIVSSDSGPVEEGIDNKAFNNTEIGVNNIPNSEKVAVTEKGKNYLLLIIYIYMSARTNRLLCYSI